MIDDQVFEEGYLAFNQKGQSARNPYSPSRDRLKAWQWGMGFFAASQDAEEEKRTQA